MISMARILGAPVTEPPGNDVRSRSSGVESSRSEPSTTETKCCTYSYVSSPHSCDTAHAIRPARARQIIAQQIDDHHIFGPIFFAGSQVVAGEHIGLGAARPPTCSLDRSCFDLAVLNANKPLRRRTGNLPFAAIEVTGERSRIAVSQAGNTTRSQNATTACNQPLR